MQTETTLLDVNEAAAVLRLKPATLRRWVFARKIPFVKVGARAIRFKRAELDRLIRAGERPALRPIGK
jgi:excisionase family DNA binding protein